jgi:hypothetical protein
MLSLMLLQGKMHKVYAVTLNLKCDKNCESGQTTLMDPVSRETSFHYKIFLMKVSYHVLLLLVIDYSWVSHSKSPFL